MPLQGGSLFLVDYTQLDSHNIPWGLESTLWLLQVAVSTVALEVLWRYMPLHDSSLFLAYYAQQDSQDILWVAYL